MGCSLKVNIDKNDSNKHDNNTENIQKNKDEGIQYKQGTALPLGTIISLKNSDEKLIISGWMQIPMDDDTIYDYSACIYPKGFLSGKDAKFFNEEDIDKIYFYGYEDNEGIDYRNKVIKYRNNLRNKSDELLKEDKTVEGDCNKYTIDEEKMLTLGSIVTVKGKEHKYMIISRIISNKYNNLFDYYGCLYPEGNTTAENNIFFNNDEIIDIYFHGYEDEKEIQRNKELIKYKNSISENK